MLDQALAYAARGWAVFPIWSVNPSTGECLCKGSAACSGGENAGKHPMTQHGVLDATTNRSTIGVWWVNRPEANIGIATGGESGLVVLDIDGDKGRASLNGSELPNGYRVTTGREEGGEHRYFQCPDFPIKNSAGELGDGLDIRSNGGYVIAAGSRHKSGKLYEESGDPDTLPELPEWLKENIKHADTVRVDMPTGSKKREGGRNIYLASLAGTIRQRGGSENEIYATISVRNAERCDPPLPDEELKQIAKSIASKPVGDELIFDDHSEHGYARRMATYYFGEIHYVKRFQQWATWNPILGVWELDGKDGTAMKQRALGMLDATYKAADTITESNLLRQQQRQQNFRAEVLKKNNYRSILGILGLTASLPDMAIEPENLDTDPWLFNVKNGTINLRTGELRNSDPADLITKLAGTHYDKTAPVPTWEQFIREVSPDAELREYVQRALGYMLTGDVSEHDFWIAHGGGANGKSTLLNTMLRVLGEDDRGYGSTTSFATFDAENKNDKGDDLATLRGRRGVVAIEVEREKNLAEARVKAVTGSDSVSCRKLYGDIFTYRPTYKIWLAVNHKPNIRGVDRGIWRRIKLVPFTQNFEAKEDLTLPDTLRLELPGILNWLLAGLRQRQQIGMAEPKAVQFATENYRAETDVLGQWIEENCETGEDYEAYNELSSVLYKNYTQWMEDRGEDRVKYTLETFSVLLSERGFVNKQETKGDDKGKRKFHGLKLAPPPPLGRVG